MEVATAASMASAVGCDVTQQSHLVAEVDLGAVEEQRQHQQHQGDYSGLHPDLNSELPK